MEIKVIWVGASFGIAAIIFNLGYVFGANKTPDVVTIKSEKFISERKQKCNDAGGEYSYFDSSLGYSDLGRPKDYCSIKARIIDLDK